MPRIKNQISDIYKNIGNKLYISRLSQGLSLKQISSMIDVTHQQLYKYEKGTNKIDLDRLILIAKALEKPLTFFYPLSEDELITTTVTQHQRLCLEVSKNFMRIHNPKQQVAVNTLIKSLIENQNP